MAININIPSQFREYNNLAAFPATGEVKILYVAKNNNKLYRWDTLAYVEVSPQLASSWGNITGNLASQVDLQGALDNKVNTISGKGLSTEDYTTTEKSKLAGIQAGAEVNVNADWNATTGDAEILNKPTIPSTKADIGLGNVDNTSDADKPVSSATQTALNAKQDTLVSATNIKTINGSSVLGSGDLVVSGGGGLQGVHALLPIANASIVPIVVNSSGMTTVATITNRLYAIPFIPSRTFTTGNIYINVTVLGVGVNARILIYSDLNGKPNTKIYESTNLDCSTTGIKTATTTQTFNAGTTYWICTQFSGIVTTTAYPLTGTMLLAASGISVSNAYYISPTFGSAPSPFGTPLLAGVNLPAIFITVA